MGEELAGSSTDDILRRYRVIPDEQENNAKRSFTEIFNEAFPYYLSMGMNWDQFWLGSARLVKSYRKAEEIKIERSMEESDFRAWITGMYTYQALCAVAPALQAFAKRPKVQPYIKGPMLSLNRDKNKDTGDGQDSSDFTVQRQKKKTRAELDQEKCVAYMEIFIANIKHREQQAAQTVRAASDINGQTLR
ncbi:MAG: hypothetical protein LBT32_01410 [Peptococcaceae bacterium]|nr:hypothetical protein [Peptococcaceae bacterium]